MSVFRSKPKNQDASTMDKAAFFVDFLVEILGDEEIGINTDACSPTSSSSSASNGVEAPDRPKRKNPPGYSTEAQKRRKREIQHLRDEVCVLEKCVAQLQDSQPNCSVNLGGTGTATSPDPAILQWKNSAKVEYQERQRAEETNRKLKAVFARQHKVDRALRHILARKVVAQAKDFTDKLNVDEFQRRLATEEGAATVTQLEDEIARLYLESTSLFPRESPLTLQNTMQPKCDKNRGAVVEIRSTTPLMCPVQSAVERVWNDLASDRFDSDKFVQCLPGLELDSCIKNAVFDWKFESQVKRVTTLQVLRKFEEPNCSIIIGAGVVRIEGETIQLRHQHSVLVSSVASKPNSSLVRACDQLYAENRTGSLGESDSNLLRRVSCKLYEEGQYFQNRLLDEVERIGGQ